MNAARAIPIAAAVALLCLPQAPIAQGNFEPVGGVNWLCFAYGALAGASIMSGSLVGAIGFGMAGARAGCFG